MSSVEQTSSEKAAEIHAQGRAIFLEASRAAEAAAKLNGASMTTTDPAAAITAVTSTRTSQIPSASANASATTMSHQGQSIEHEGNEQVDNAVNPNGARLDSIQGVFEPQTFAEFLAEAEEDEDEPEDYPFWWEELSGGVWEPVDYHWRPRARSKPWGRFKAAVRRMFGRLKRRLRGT